MFSGKTLVRKSGIKNPMFTAERIADLETRKTLIKKGIIKNAPKSTPTGITCIEDSIRQNLIVQGILTPRA